MQPLPLDKPQMLKTILVATDFSPTAGAAMRWAVELARQQQARLVLIHALGAPHSSESRGEQDRRTAEAKAMLSKAAAAAQPARIALHTECRAGKAWEVIVDEAARQQADLIVIGSRGLGAFDRMLLGSVADRVIRTSPVPVLTVHPGDAEKTPRFQTILAATDFSEESALATSAAVRIMRGCPDRARLALVHACMPPEVFVDPDVPVATMPDWNEIEIPARRAIEALAAPLRSDRLSVETRVERSYPVDAIRREARLLNADLIAVGTQGRTGLNRLMMGSVAERVVHHADYPVLTVRRPDPGEPIQLSADR